MGASIQELNLDWSVILRGDIGGFGISSDFSWNVQGGVIYAVSDWLSVVGQYRALDVDFQNEEAGLDFLSYDTTTHGPIAGLVFRF